MIEAERRAGGPAVGFPAAEEPAPASPPDGAPVTTPSRVTRSASRRLVASTRAGAPEIASEERATGTVNLGRRFFNVKTGLSFLLGIAILFALFRFSDVQLSEILAQLREVDPRVYALAAICYTFTFPFRGLRWQRLLANAGSRLPLSQLTEVIFISWFVNSVLPGKVGDVYRGYLLRREHGLSLSRTVGTVVAERVVDLCGLVSLLGITGFFVLRNRVSPVVDGMLHAGWIGLAVLIGGLFVLNRFGDRLAALFPAPVQAIYAKFAHGTFASLSSLKGLPLLVLLTILAWSAEAGRLYFVMQALDVQLGPLAALFTVAAISLALIVPTPGGLGGVEAAFAGVLAVFGVPLQVALAVALLDRLISYYSLILFGLPAFLLTRRGR
jgi:glycosyltransferase 2 family protein